MSIFGGKFSKNVHNLVVAGGSNLVLSIRASVWASVCLHIFLSIFHVDLPLEIDPNDENSDHFQKKNLQKKLTDGILQKKLTDGILQKKLTDGILQKNYGILQKNWLTEFYKKNFLVIFFPRMLATSKNWHSSKTFVKFRRSKFFVKFRQSIFFCKIPSVNFFCP